MSYLDVPRLQTPSGRNDGTTAGPSFQLPFPLSTSSLLLALWLSTMGAAGPPAAPAEPAADAEEPATTFYATATVRERPALLGHRGGDGARPRGHRGVGRAHRRRSCCAFVAGRRPVTGTAPAAASPPPRSAAAIPTSPSCSSTACRSTTPPIRSATSSTSRDCRPRRRSASRSSAARSPPSTARPGSRAHPHHHPPRDGPLRREIEAAARRRLLRARAGARSGGGRRSGPDGFAASWEEEGERVADESFRQSRTSTVNARPAARRQREPAPRQPLRRLGGRRLPRRLRRPRLRLGRAAAGGPRGREPRRSIRPRAAPRDGSTSSPSPSTATTSTRDSPAVASRCPPPAERDTLHRSRAAAGRRAPLRSGGGLQLSVGQRTSSGRKGRTTASSSCRLTSAAT